VEAVTSLLRREEVRLLTLTGTGGTGKTRLALQIGGAVLDEFERGVFFVSLASITDASLIPSTIAGTLKVKETPGESLVETLCGYLRDKQILLVLDNFEHLLEGAPVVSELLAACPELKVLITSRAVLHLSGEYDYPVPPLSVPDPKHLPDVPTLSQYDAVALFIQRAQAAKPDFSVTNDNAPAVAEICHRLDGLPLAIELAAARIRLLPPQALLARLSSRLKLLTRGARDAPTRQQTLRGTIDWSYGLLDEGEQTLFARLAVFQGGCTLEAVEAVSSAEGELDLLEGMASLVDQNLLQQQGEDEPRFAMLETIREYALERLHGAGEDGTIRERHAEYYTTLAETAEPELTGGDQTIWLERLESEHENLRAALAWFREHGEDGGLRLAAALWRFWLTRGHLTEGRGWLEEVVARAGQREASPALRAKALNGAGNLTFAQGDDSRAQDLHAESLRLRQELGDKRGIAASLINLGNVAWRQGAYERARALYEESLPLMQELGDKRGIANRLHNLGMVAYMQGDYSRAGELYERDLRLRQELGDKEGLSYSLNCLGLVAYVQGSYERAQELFKESLRLRQELGYKWGIVDSLVGLAGVAGAQRQHERAAQLLAAAVAGSEAIGAVLDRTEQEIIEEVSKAARSVLSAEGYERAWTRGRAMSTEEAIAYALGESRWVRLEGDEALSTRAEQPAQPPRYRSDQV
jgi:predicted ATPase